MKLSKEQIQEIINKYGKSPKDSGRPEVQIALFTAAIQSISNHLKANVKDHHSRLGLIKMVSKRKSLLEYLQRKDVERYKRIIQELEIRK